MKLTAPTSELLNALSIVFGFASPKSPKEILQSVKVISAPEGTKLMATDMEASISVDAPGIQYDGEGAVLLCRKVLEVIRLTTDEETTLEKDGDSILVNNRTKLKAQNADEYPTVNIDDTDAYHEITREALITGITRTIYATDPTNSRFALGGVAFDMDDINVSLIATDGRRLSVQSITGSPVGGHSIKYQNCIVPAHSVQQMLMVLKRESSETVKVKVNSSTIIVVIGNTSLQFRLLEGRYPNWEAIIPTEDGQQMTVAAGPLGTAIRQCAITTDKESRGVDMTAHGNELILQSGLSEIGDSRIPCPIQYDGDEIKLRFDHQYMTDIVKSMDAEAELTVGMINGSSPIKIRSNDGFEGVIMPMVNN